MAWQGQTRRGGTIGFEQGSALSGQISAWGRDWALGAAPWHTPQPSTPPGAVLLPCSMRIAAVYPRQTGRFRVGPLVLSGGSTPQKRAAAQVLLTSKSMPSPPEAPMLPALMERVLSMEMMPSAVVPLMVMSDPVSGLLLRDIPFVPLFVEATVVASTVQYEALMPFEPD